MRLILDSSWSLDWKVETSELKFPTVFLACSQAFSLWACCLTYLEFHQLQNTNNASFLASCVMNASTESLVSAATYFDFHYDLVVYAFLLELCFCDPSFRDGFLPACCRNENSQVGSVTEGYQV